MLTIILSAIYLSSLAAEPIAPPDLCKGRWCAEGMESVNQQFHTEGQLLSSEDIPTVYSGQCFHLSPWLNPLRAEHGFLFTDSRDNKFYINGQFTYGPDTNPYADLTLKEAREKLPNHFSHRHILQLADTFAFSDMNPERKGGVVMFYWLRKAKDGSLLVLAQWGGQQTVACRMSKNPRQ